MSTQEQGDKTLENPTRFLKVLQVLFSVHVRASHGHVVVARVTIERDREAPDGFKIVDVVDYAHTRRLELEDTEKQIVYDLIANVMNRLRDSS